jgi:hypothetical protein
VLTSQVNFFQESRFCRCGRFLLTNLALVDLIDENACESVFPAVSIFTARFNISLSYCTKLARFLFDAITAREARKPIHRLKKAGLVTVFGVLINELVVESVHQKSSIGIPVQIIVDATEPIVALDLLNF